VERGDILRVIGQRSRTNAVANWSGNGAVHHRVRHPHPGAGIGHRLRRRHLQGDDRPRSRLSRCAGRRDARGHRHQHAALPLPLFGGPVSEGARSLLQALGLDVFIAVVAVNTAPNVAGAYTGGYVSLLLAIGLMASLLPPLAAWVVGRTVLDLNPAILLGMICGARHSTPRCAPPRRNVAAPSRRSAIRWRTRSPRCWCSSWAIWRCSCSPSTFRTRPLPHHRKRQPCAASRAPGCGPMMRPPAPRRARPRGAHEGGGGDISGPARRSATTRWIAFRSAASLMRARAPCARSKVVPSKTVSPTAQSSTMTPSALSARPTRAGISRSVTTRGPPTWTRI